MAPARSLAFVAAALIGLAVVRGGWGWLLLWPALNFAGLAVAHGRGAAGLFGKRPDGTLSAGRVLLFFPLLITTWSVWHLWRLASRENPFDEVTESLVIGRRLLPSEFPPGIDGCVDLTSEFAEPRAIVRAARYHSLPLLDAAGLSPQSLADAARSLPPGRTYIHCAQGHGRTALFASALLISRGEAATADEAFERIRSIRPGVRLSPSQKRCLEECARLLRQTETPASGAASARR